MGNDRNLAKISQKLRIKWNFELTVFELTVPDLYLDLFVKAQTGTVRLDKSSVAFSSLLPLPKE